MGVKIIKKEIKVFTPFQLVIDVDNEFQLLELWGRFNQNRVFVVDAMFKSTLLDDDNPRKKEILEKLEHLDSKFDYEIWEILDEECSNIFDNQEKGNKNESCS